MSEEDLCVGNKALYDFNVDGSKVSPHLQRVGRFDSDIHSREITINSSFVLSNVLIHFLWDRRVRRSLHPSSLRQEVNLFP